MKRKLQHFEEFTSFPNTFEPDNQTVLSGEFQFKGKWNEAFFKNSNPIILELGCGKGEYSVGLAKLFPQNNYIGIDIKGARMWRGAKTSIEENLKNIAFIRTHIDWLESFFSKGEVSEIWITFPDPYPRQCKERKRLTSPVFLKKFQNVLTNIGIINLKTDNYDLYQYTLSVIKENNLKIQIQTSDLYSDFKDNSILEIRTHYENIWLSQGKKICYLRYQL